MKTMTFNISKSKKNSNNFRINNSLTDYSKILDAIITSNVKAKNPYLFGEDTGWDGFDYSTKKPIKIDITLKKKNTSCSGCPLKGMCKDYNYDLNTFADAIEFLTSYKGKDDYDFKLCDGTPVKFFHDHVQIGYNLYYLGSDYSPIYAALDEPAKKSIIDIYVNLK